MILLCLLATERKGRPFPGRTFWGYMLLYGISRFIIEFYRGDARGTVGMFSTSQFVSLLIVPLSIVMLFLLAPVRSRRRRRPRGARGRRDERSMDETGERSSSKRIRTAAARPFSDRAPSRPVALADSAVDQGRAGDAASGTAVRASTAVKPVERTTSTFPSRAAAAPEPEALPLRIVYEDPDVVVLDKPAGMVVHPGAGHSSGTLVNALLHHVKDLSGIGGELRPGIVHRLDRGTSGLMVVAKHDRATRNCPASSAIAKWIRNTWRWSGAWCRRAGGSTRPSGAIPATARRCRRARGAREAP